ncbi:glycosyltransferase [Pontibacter chitinilyticus]|uniref:glycosyltransferase n=1 Tax=Pontibacter chitinilyticus TaxID=2674989 RepID=UPI00321A63C2
MNIFVIPSWYPSADYPISGSFVKEQAAALCKAYPDINVGVSIWGQQDEKYLLWAKDHFKNIGKITSASHVPYKKQLLSNFTEYYCNTFTWSRSFLHGNSKAIIQANLRNLKAFEADYGPVDLLHGHLSPYAGNIIQKVSEATGIPFCLTEHNPPSPCPNVTTSGGQLKEKYSTHYQNAAATIAISLQSAMLMKQQGVKRIRLIPNHLDERLFKPFCSTAPLQPFTFLTIAQLSTLKGIAVLLKAIDIFAEHIPETKFLVNIAGDGDKVTYAAIAKELGIEDKVVWLGKITRQEALEQHQRNDVFILPSLIENLPVVLLEAIACGKPIIATKCGGPESIVTSQNGLLVEKNDPEGLAQAMLYMMNNYDKYDRHVIRQDFLDRFSSQAVLPQLVQLYQDSIHKHKAKK